MSDKKKAIPESDTPALRCLMQACGLTKEEQEDFINKNNVIHTVNGEVQGERDQ